MTTTLAITEGTTMARTPALEAAERSAAPEYGRCDATRQVRRNGVCCLLLAVGTAVAVPVFAAEPAGSSGTAGKGGYYGQSYTPGKTPAASANAPSAESKAAASVNAPAVESKIAAPRLYAAPDASSLLYQPGFHGCAPAARINSMGGLRSGLVPLPSVPPQKQGRYARFGITTAETYTDNVNLANDDNAESVWVTQVVPSLSACADSGRIRASLDYQLQALFYAGSDVSNEVYNHVAGATTVEILPGHLFLAADSTYGQTVIDPSGVFSDTNLLRANNRTSAWITNISPYWFQRLGRVGQATLRYRYGRAEYGSPDVSDYTLNGVYLNLSGPPSNRLWSYQLSMASQRVERDEVMAGRRGSAIDDDGVTHFDSATLQLGYWLTESLELLGMAGVEDDYHPDGSVDRFGSAIWNVGFRWTSPTNTLEARYGERAFGSSYSVEATHHAPAFDVTLTYREDTTAAGLAHLNRGAVGTAGSLPGPIAPIEDQGVYVRKRLSAALAFATARTQTTLQAYHETREFLTTNEPDEDVNGLDLQISYQLGARTTLRSSAQWEHRDSGQDEADIAKAGIGATYLLTPSSQAAISYSHAWRDDEMDTNSYDENRVTVQYSIFF